MRGYTMAFFYGLRFRSSRRKKEEGNSLALLFKFLVLKYLQLKFCSSVEKENVIDYVIFFLRSTSIPNLVNRLFLISAMIHGKLYT